MRTLRHEAGYTQEQTAERAALDPKHVQAIEAGTVNVTIASLLGLARALGVKLCELVVGV